MIDAIQFSAMQLLFSSSLAAEIYPLKRYKVEVWFKLTPLHLESIHSYQLNCLRGKTHFKHQIFLCVNAELRVNIQGEKLPSMLTKVPLHFGYHFWLNLKTQKEI